MLSHENSSGRSGDETGSPYTTAVIDLRVAISVAPVSELFHISWFCAGYFVPMSPVIQAYTD
jgi:hypothetical protein